MKSFTKVIGVLALTFALSFTANTADAQSTNGLFGKARGELSQCLNNYNGPLYEIGFSLAVVDCFTQPCPVAYIVFVSAGPNCQPNQVPCPAFPTILVGTVEFDADGKVVNSNSICD